MTPTRKVFAAMCLVMILSGGTVAAANSGPGVQQTAVAPVARAIPAPSDRRMAFPTLTVTDVSYDVADERAARVNVTATGVLRNSNKESINLRDVQVMLRDAEGKVAIPAKIEVVGGGKETLGRGEAAHVRFTFAAVPTDGAALRMSLDSPSGGTLINAFTITISCSYPPLKCTLTINFAD